ncbi:glutamine synthetase III [Anaerococcus sp. AGMB00486]|uniref:Glutamine synthetase III n=1 Tax=Anaerococcus faecalis TaxID=2742993 RepID=A0ABX2NCT4_9FIRM|nr:glutamine synthetase III [Anaerococcus faecalis]NVF12344.1 glutamine synthetase III [Anaerococcus faecalis]
MNLKEFGNLAFDKKTMKENVPYPVYLKWKEAARNNINLDKETADSIAHAMKAWAISKGATSYTHWFQPLNGKTANKKTAFLNRDDKHNPIHRFSGNELIKGEPDASSFPSGGMRSTFEARGYTYWDLTANSFIEDETLYIPSVFVSFYGEKLDKKLPLMESMNRISKEASRVCNLFLKDEKTYRVKPKVGLEQEFYLIDKKYFDKRIDLEYCGMSLIGSDPMVEKELISHYLGAIPQRVNDFFEDVNKQLYDLGIYMEAEHNEVGPNQFEIAIMFENCNISVDNNQLLMHILEKTAIKHKLACLLKEKPFKNMAGSGKHNNYSLATNYGKNCFSPGKDPKNNPIFLLFLSAMIEVCYKYQDLIRVTTSSVTNDFRLGGNEAPPSIISMFIGNDLEDMLKSISENNFESVDIDNRVNIPHLGEIKTDSSDRNRTSPIAFTGNKFEFRMLGSSKTASDLNTLINLAMAQSMKKIADRLEKIDEKDLMNEVYKIVKEIYDENKNILFQGDGYSKQWLEEAKKRGLKNHKSFLDALINARNSNAYKLYKDEKIFTDKEIESIINVELEEVGNFYSSELEILNNMIYQEILPSSMKEIKEIKEYLSFVENEKLKEKAQRINKKVEELLEYGEDLKEILKKFDQIDDIEEKACFIQEKALVIAGNIREVSDSLEIEISRENYSIPRYVDMLKSL